MRRKRTDERSTWTYTVYTFAATLGAASPPPRWPDALRQVVWAQRDLWNACHAAWERNRAAYDQLMEAEDSLRPLRDARDTAHAVLLEVRGVQKKARQQAQRKRYGSWEADAQAVEAAGQDYRQATDALQSAEAAYRVHIKPQLTALLETLWQDIHALGQASPLAWYNERQVTDSFRNCVERFLKRMGGPPQPKRFMNRAHLTYHFTGPPLTWEQLLLGKSSMITFGAERGVLPVPPWVWETARSRHERHEAWATEAHLRLSDTATLTFGTQLYRRPPVGALIKGVELVGREQARGWQDHLPLWQWIFYVLCEIPPHDRAPAGDSALQEHASDPVPGGEQARTVTLTADSVPGGEQARLSTAQTSDPVPGGEQVPLATVRVAPVPGGEQALHSRRVAIDLNWRLTAEDRVRVGMLYDGHTAEPFFFPAHLMRRWRFAQTLQQAIASALLSTKEALQGVWHETPLPPDLDPRGAGWAQTGQGGLLRLLRQVEALPPAMPARAPTLRVLESWARRTGRLWREWRGVSQHLNRAKTTWYCETAKRLCTAYHAIALEALDFRRMAEAPDQAPRLAHSQQYRQLVGLSALLTRLTQTAQREGVTLVRINPAYTSRTCPQCGTVLSSKQWAPQAGEQFIQCPQGCRFDVDSAAAQSIWQRAFAP